MTTPKRICGVAALTLALALGLAPGASVADSGDARARAVATRLIQHVKDNSAAGAWRASTVWRSGCTRTVNPYWSCWVRPSWKGQTQPMVFTYPKVRGTLTKTGAVAGFRVYGGRGIG